MTTNTVPQGLFGPGILYLTRTDIANATPTNVGYVNEFSTDFTFSTKELYGQNKAATLSGQALNSLLIGGTWTAGTQYEMASTAATPIPTTPYEITPTVPSSGTWNSDLGVVNAATYEPLTQVPSAPTAGQYSVSAGVYTFSSADHGSAISVIITYSYTFASGATGQSMTITNQPIGTTPTFQLDYKTALYGSTYYIRLFQAVANKWTMGHKLEDFAMPEYDFSFFANAAQQIGIISLATLA